MSHKPGLKKRKKKMAKRKPTTNKALLLQRIKNAFGSKKVKSEKRGVSFEALEPRILLSADPLSYTASGGDITLAILEDETTAATYQIWNDDELVAEKLVAETEYIEIIGSEEDENLLIDDSFIDQESMPFYFI